MASKQANTSAVWLLGGLFSAIVGCGGDDGATAPTGSGDAAVDGSETSLPTPEEFLEPPVSCAFDCNSECEPTGYVCPVLGDWKTMSHTASCGAFDGKTMPTPTPGKCKATLPVGEASKKTGVDTDTPANTILPTGARTIPIGKVSGFTDFKGQFPSNVVTIAGTELAIVVDGGINEQSVRLVDTTKIGGADAVLGREKFTGSTNVNYGAVVLRDASPIARLYVSGGAGSIVYAFKVDLTEKKLIRDATSDIPVKREPGKPEGGGIGSAYLLSGMAVSPDQKRLFVGTGNSRSGGTPLFVIDVDPTSPTYKAALKQIELKGREIFSVSVHPADKEGRYAYVSVWDQNRVEIVDTAAGTSKSLTLGKAPQAFAPLGTRYLAVVTADADEITLIDTLATAATTVLTVPIVKGAQLGFAPGGMVYDDAGKRLYITLAQYNAVAAFDVNLPADGSIPTISPAGMLGTEWWPTAVALRDDKSLVVVNGKGRGTGSNPIPFGPGEGDITDRMRGSVQIIPPPDSKMLSAGKVAFDIANTPGKLTGASKVECAGAAYDFPIPETNVGGSTKIKRVIFVVKENKTFDAVFGDMPGLDGDPKLVMAPGKQEKLFPNQRKMAKEFVNFDNYYTSAEQSLQGHFWTAFGRSTEFLERTWLVTWGRGYRSPTQGVVNSLRPAEGSVFDWLQREKVTFDNMGELVGAAEDNGAKPRNCCTDSLYPGKVYAMDEPDTRKGCYVAARARVSCDLKQFTYALMPNDHTSGGTPGKPTPETYIAVGDEGLGILLDGLSRSPLWPETLLIVTEDDPQDGGDHVDAHRTPFAMASPWTKRGYISKGHYDVSSVHKLLAHVYGKPYPNEVVARAALPLDAFTSTPDYSPYNYVKRAEPVACNPRGGKFAAAATMSQWDFSIPDHAPGLSKQLWEMLHGTPVPSSFLPDDDDD